MFTMKRDMFGWPSVVSDDLFFKSVEQNICKRFQNFPVNLHKFNALFFTRLSQLG
jgi:hypothetical protein